MSSCSSVKIDGFPVCIIVAGSFIFVLGKAVVFLVEDCGGVLTVVLLVSVVLVDVAFVVGRSRDPTMGGGVVLARLAGMR